MIELTNPLGDIVEVDDAEILIIFFSKFLSPPRARSNVIVAGTIRSFLETPQQVARIVGQQTKLIKLTLPDTGIPDRAKGSIWFRLDAVKKVESLGSGAQIKLKGQQGVTQVVESKEQVDAAISKARG